MLPDFMHMIEYSYVYSSLSFLLSDSLPALRKEPPTTHMPTPMTTLYRGDSQFSFMAVTVQIEFAVLLN